MSVSRETRERLETFHRVLKRWQRSINLISDKSDIVFWERHILDSLQLVDYSDGRKNWVDIGSGGGFPGVVVGIYLAELSSGVVHLVEIDARKCVFLREVARETGARVVVHNGYAQDILPRLHNVDVVTSRAVAPLGDLLSWSAMLLEKGAIGLFLKGKNVAEELTENAALGKFDINVFPSRTKSSGFVVRAISPTSSIVVKT
jgi:16S rRNA (guanine527-N7)-methyltransferase